MVYFKKRGGENILKSCSYCGKFHKKDYICDKKPMRRKFDTVQNKFRSTNAWAKKRKQIKERDGFLCQICLKNLFETKKQYNSSDLEVHHIISLFTDETQKLDDDNLIILCTNHHKLADAGIIPVKLLKDIVLSKK